MAPIETKVHSSLYDNIIVSLPSGTGLERLKVVGSKQVCDHDLFCGVVVMMGSDDLPRWGVCCQVVCCMGQFKVFLSISKDRQFCLDADGM